MATGCIQAPWDGEARETDLVQSDRLIYKTKNQL